MDGRGPAPASALSSGFHPAPRRPVPDVARAAARDRGVELSDHRSSVVRNVLASRSGGERWLAFVMDAGQRRRLVRDHGFAASRVLVLGDLDPLPVERRAIRDPYGQPRDVFEEVYDRIERCVGEAVRRMGPGDPPAR